MPGLNIERAIGRMPQVNEGNQGQQRTHQRVQEELERRIHAIGAAPHTDDQIHGYQRGFKEHIEQHRSEEHTSELQSLMRISYAVFCLTKKKTKQNNT